ncbi:MAG: Re/Si-specific transhydrogenase subunit alpha [Devosia sp.]|uniref:Re/Si-specific NAD(P)(+) transhydrogenase subunit alpha n=1 Tax=Devosia sp. TaxID=1871048 RepID=UPI00262E4A42|nr:Re/Si-specific NAD(P)(+) transhydrogenase subunit alpha [Devosia sp.]MDB5538323.1 Re/Si-specific transhydrogenase subunit alpha [Devosia sp.]
MKIAVLRERAEGETRVAATPETVTKLIGLGASVAIESGAGDRARFPDKDYVAAGATVGPAAATIKGADIVLTVRRPQAASLAGVAPGALVIGALDPYGNEGEIADLARAGVTAIAMEFMPRITRAQVMDILSSQANLAGYQAVIDAAAAFDRAMPMMMTAAGTVRPAKVFVMGAGVAGLQAIATAKRLGAVVTATDVRAAAAEQVASLGGKFIMTDALKDASGAGGYARELTKDEQAAQSELVAGHIAKQDIVITTALIPGRPAPRLVTKAMVESMAPGSVLVDLAAERGGNIELTQPGKSFTTVNGVTIIGFTNVAGRLPTSASQLYARNLVSFLETLIDKKEKKLAVNWDDELVKATVLTRDGAIVNPNIKVEAVPAAAPKPAAALKAAPKKPAADAAAAKPAAATAARKPAAPRKPAAKETK